MVVLSSFESFRFVCFIVFKLYYKPGRLLLAKAPAMPTELATKWCLQENNRANHSSYPSVKPSLPRIAFFPTYFP
ncbi:hypothetical protein TWF225_011480 [Orbilia oligospora]|nr:hypothetical protein TWF225_011480 [Orbilia oligospora]KAF3281421.1 hypothetical protein TWF132_011191 [Orbilia oligospora]